MIEGHGDDIYKYDSVRMNFSSNIYGHADLSALKEHLKAHIDSIGSYPEPQPYTLQNVLAAAHDVSPECVLVTNGATEAIYLIAQAFRNGVWREEMPPRYFVRTPTFSEYEDAMRSFSYKEAPSNLPPLGEASDLLEKELREAPFNLPPLREASNLLDKELVVGIETSLPFPESDSEVLAWMCNPNNPTGEVVPQKEIDAMCQQKGTLLVIDQSYEDYTQSQLLTAQEAVKRGNVILIHSMTKTYAIPGLRIGYVMAAPEIIRRISDCQHPWSVNALAIEAALFLLKEQMHVIPDLNVYLDETEQLRLQLNQIDGITAFPTKTNFFLCETHVGTAAQLKAYLVEKHGILIRDASNFKGLSERHFRVATQSPTENRALVKGIEDYISNSEYE